MRRNFTISAYSLNAGHETTTNLIGNGVELLIRFPEAQQRLRDDPSLIDSGIEEMLRYESSNQLGNRTTTEALEIGGHTGRNRVDPVYRCRKP